MIIFGYVPTKWLAGKIQGCREMLWSVCCRAPALSPAKVTFDHDAPFRWHLTCDKVTFGHDVSFMWQVFHDSLSPGLGLYCLQPRGCSDPSRLTMAIPNQLGTPETFSHDLKTQAAHLVQVEVGHYDAVEGDGERHQACWQLKTYKGPQHLMAIQV